MHFGNMKFKQKQREEQAEADGTESKNRTQCFTLIQTDVEPHFAKILRLTISGILAISPVLCTADFKRLRPEWCLYSHRC